MHISASEPPGPHVPCDTSWTHPMGIVAQQLLTNNLPKCEVITLIPQIT